MENARDLDPPDPRMIDMSPRGMMASTRRAGVEGDGRLGRGTVDRVDHGFEQTQLTGWEADTCANYYAVVDVTG